MNNVKKILLIISVVHCVGCVNNDKTKFEELVDGLFVTRIITNYTTYGVRDGALTQAYITYEFEDYNFDHIFVCLSPQYTPKQHWHYFSMFISTFEEMTGKDAIIHTDKFQFHTNLDRVHNEILHQCSNGR